MLKVDVIIPTFGRDARVVENAIQSILEDGTSLDYLESIILIDQNTPKLTILPNDKLIHHHQPLPSLPAARNKGVELSSSEFLVFFDDDVIVKKGSLANFANLFRTMPDADFFAGREVLLPDQQENKRKGAVNSLKRFIKNRVLVKPNEIAKISKNGFFFCDFSKELPHPISIDTVRGCIFAIKKSSVIKAGGFDPGFRGNSLREETDLILRARKNGAKGYYTSDSEVLHLRQFGGCDNLSRSRKALKNTLANELRFQRKHYSKTSPFLFFMRLLPTTFEFFKETFGESLVVAMGTVRRFSFSKDVSTVDYYYKLKYSVVINTYGRSSLLVERAIRHALNQTPEPLSVVLVDQNPVPLQLSSELIQDPLLVVERIPTKKLAKARNNAPLHRETEWIVFCDDDGYMAENYAERLQRFLQLNQELDMVGGSIIRDDNMRFYSPRQRVSGDMRKFRFTKLLMGSNFAIKKEAFFSLGGIDENFGIGSIWPSSEETDLTWRAYFKGVRMAFNKELIVFHPPAHMGDLKTSARKSYQYGIGKGALVAKWLLNEKKPIALYELGEMTLVPLAKMVKSLITLNFKAFLITLASFIGRYNGLMAYCRRKEEA